MLSLLMPTRGRPGLARRFLDSVALCTGRLDDVEVVIYVDDDDVDSHALGHDRVSVKRIIGASATMGEYKTACLDRAEGSIVMLVK